MDRALATRNDIIAARWIAAIADAVEEAGLSLVERDDQAGFQAACAELEGKGDASPPMSPAFFDIDPADLFWFESRDADGELIAVQAMKREVISVTLDQHLDRQYRRIYTDPLGGRIISHAPAVYDITGTLAYHGDLFIRRDWRQNAIAPLLGRLAVGVAHMRWRPDYVWGFIAKKLVMSGYPVKIGYHRIQAMGTRYATPPKGVRPDDYFVWMTVADLEDLFRAEGPPRREPKSHSQIARAREPCGTSGVPALAAQ